MVVRVRCRVLALLLACGGAGCAGHGLAADVPAGVRYLPRGEWGARPPLKEPPLHVPSRITIHHTATQIDPARPLADKMRSLQQFSQTEGALATGQRKPAWADVPYHFYVAADGEVAEGRELRYVGDSNTPYDPTGHLLIVVEGNFDVEQPTPAQLQALDRLVQAFSAQWRISGSRVAGHGDYASTRCPGRNLTAELPRLRMLADRAGR